MEIHMFEYRMDMVVANVCVNVCRLNEPKFGFAISINIFGSGYSFVFLRLFSSHFFHFAHCTALLHTHSHTMRIYSTFFIGTRLFSALLFQLVFCFLRKELR